MQLHLGLEQLVFLAGLGVVEQELDGAVDGVEEAIDDHLVHVVDVRLPRVTVLVRFQQLEVLLEQRVQLLAGGGDLRVPAATRHA